MNTRLRQSGFSAVEIVIVVVAALIIGFLGYVFYNSQMNKTASDDTSQTSNESATADDVDTAPSIDSVEDLDEAEATLDKNDPAESSSSDSSQLDSELSNF